MEDEIYDLQLQLQIQNITNTQQLQRQKKTIQMLKYELECAKK